MKKKRILVMALVLVMAASLLCPAAFAGTQQFSDVPTTHWSYEAVTAVAGGGLVEGFPEGTFRPDEAITVAQLATIVTRAMGEETYTENGYWAYGALNYCINELKCMPSFGDIITKNYDVVCTRELAAYVLVNSIGSHNPDLAKPELTEADIPDFADVSEQYKAAVLEAYQLGLCKGKDTKGTFEPQGSFTRAQVAQMLVNANVTTAGAGKTEDSTEPESGMSAEEIQRLREYDMTVSDGAVTYEEAKAAHDAEWLLRYYGDRSNMDTFQGAHDFLYIPTTYRFNDKDGNAIAGTTKFKFDDLGKSVVPETVEEFLQLVLAETKAEVEYESENLIIRFYTDEDLMYHQDTASGASCTVRGTVELIPLQHIHNWTPDEQRAYFQFGFTGYFIERSNYRDVDIHMWTLPDDDGVGDDSVSVDEIISLCENYYKD